MGKVIDIKCVEETILYRELVVRNNSDTKGLVANIRDLCEEASDRAKFIPKAFAEYTLHDSTHFLRVIELMAYILGDTIKHLNDIEITLLILSAFYHDQGMLIDSSEFYILESSDDYIIFRENWYLSHPNYGEISKLINTTYISEDEKFKLSKKLVELDTAMLTAYLRDKHGERAHDYILQTFANDKRIYIYGISLADDLAEICLSHTKSINWITNNKRLKFDENIGSVCVNTIFLSFVLRLADILDFDSDRTPDVLFNSIHFTNPISVLEWQKHRSVRGWQLSEQKVQFTMYFDHPVYEKTTRTFLDWIDDELEGVHAEVRKFPAEFANYKIKVADKVDRSRIGAKNNSYLFHDLEFSLSRNEVVKLLMTDNLYQNSSLFLRELLQNSLDAIRLRKAILKKDGFNWMDGKVQFRHYLDEEGQEVVECQDNGCGMDEMIITNFLGKVGRSYYRSPEFEQLRSKLRENDADFEPCSQFGIGFMSLFMVGDRIIITTRKDYGHGKTLGKPLIVEINGLGGLMVIKEGVVAQEVGTTIKVYTREKPLYYDEWRDNIRLMLTIKGNAIATEFPITAICEIKEIKGKCEIPTTIDKKKTFLENIKLRNMKTFEIDLTEINENLRGYLRQSFLLDEQGLPCIENDEAKWERKPDKTWNEENNKMKKTIFIKHTQRNIEYQDLYGLDKGHSVCIDGILVCGYPGRSEYSELEMFGLGRMNPQVHLEHPFTIDIRGNIKPEITPARKPTESHFDNHNRPGWRRIQSLLDKGGGKMWKEVLELTNKGLSAETFWQLLFIYGGAHNYSILDIESASIIKHLQLPIAEGKWIKLSDIRSFNFNKTEIRIKDFSNMEYITSFSEEIEMWANCDVNKWENQGLLISILKSVSELRFNEIEPTYFIRGIFDEKEISSYYKLFWARAIPFVGIGPSYIASIKHPRTVNSLNNLVQLALKAETLIHKNDVETFASRFVNSISHYISDQISKEKDIEIDFFTNIFKYEAILYTSIDWTKYSRELKPPYKIYVETAKTIEITDEMLRSWTKI